jgi:filamentous hemagglutinin
LAIAIINAGSGPNITDSKYEAGKALIGNLLNNGSDSSSSSGVTRSAISAGVVDITDEDQQIKLTGKTTAETVASLSRDTTTAHTTAQKQNVQSMMQTAEAERAIKQEAFKQITAVTTDLVYKQQTADKKIILQK